MSARSGSCRDHSSLQDCLGRQVRKSQVDDELAEERKKASPVPANRDRSTHRPRQRKSRLYRILGGRKSEILSPVSRISKKRERDLILRQRKIHAVIVRNNDYIRAIFSEDQLLEIYEPPLIQLLLSQKDRHEILAKRCLRGARVGARRNEIKKYGEAARGGRKFAAKVRRINP